VLNKAMGHGRAVWALLATILLAATPVGCREGDPLDAGINPATPGWLAEDPGTGVTDHFVTIRRSSTDGGTITLEVVVTEVDESVGSLSMKLTYPREFSRFDRCLDGDLFEVGIPCLALEEGEGSGEVLISAAAAGPQDATSVSGEQVIVRLNFLVFGVGQGELGIVGPNLVGSEVTALQDADGDIIQMDWYSGVLTGE